MNIYRRIDDCRAAVRQVQRSGKTVGLVPTMGALHEGHLSLVRAARDRCASVAVTIFVNPSQFGPSEDFAEYPQPLEADLAACESLGVDIVFVPGVEEMYPTGARTTVHVSGVTECLCGLLRPGHFDGVTTVVAKLFNILPAEVAFFGEKDYQQLVVVRRMASDLNIPIEIVGCETVRESDGLAMSSRNAYLSDSERLQAVSLSRTLFDAQNRIAKGERDAVALTHRIRSDILAAGSADIEYIEVVHSETLKRIATVDQPARICLAVCIGSTRLIDNVATGV